MKKQYKKMMSLALALVMTASTMVTAASAAGSKASTKVQAAAATNATQVNLDVTVPTIYAFVVSADYTPAASGGAESYAVKVYEPNHVTNATDGIVYNNNTDSDSNKIINKSTRTEGGTSVNVAITYKASVETSGSAWKLTTAPAAAFDYSLSVKNEANGNYTALSTTTPVTGTVNAGSTMSDLLKVGIATSVTAENYFKAIQTAIGGSSTDKAEKKSSVSADVAVINWEFAANLA